MKHLASHGLASSWLEPYLGGLKLNSEGISWKLALAAQGLG